MRKTIAYTVLAVIFVMVPALALADTWVNGHYRSNGTYVKGHYRSDADGNPYNNWSFPGNTNPYTGETASGNPSTYLNNYYNSDSNYSSYSTPSYSNSYTSDYYSSYPSSDYSSYISPSYYSYSSGIESVYGGERIGGYLFCDYGYYEKNDACYDLPDNAYANYSYDGFSCRYGYEKVGSACVKEEKDLGSYYNSYLPASSYLGYYAATASEPYYKTSKFDNVRHLKIYGSVRSRVSLNSQLSCTSLFPMENQLEERDMCSAYRELDNPGAWSDIKKEVSYSTTSSVSPKATNPIYTDVPVSQQNTQNQEISTLQKQIEDLLKSISAIQSQLDSLQ